MVFDILLKIVEYFSNKEVYLFVAAVVWVSILMINHLSSDGSTNTFGYIVFAVILYTVISVLWPLSIIVVLAIYISVTLDNIKKMRKKYKELNKKLCGITDC